MSLIKKGKSKRDFVSEGQTEETNQMGIKFEYCSSIIMRVLGFIIILAGCFLMYKGVTSEGNFDVKIGDWYINYSYSSIGGVVAIIGGFMICKSKPKVNLKK